MSPSEMPVHGAKPTAADLHWITTQLGRTDATVLTIAARRTDNKPSVIVNHPLIVNTNKLIPFPTLYWLVCPDLIKAVSRLEMNGWITRLEEQIHHDPALASAVEHDNARYAATRLSLLTDDDRQAAKQQGILGQLQSTGVAGNANPARLKCLHAHVAHQLAERNTIGQRVLDEIR